MLLKKIVLFFLCFAATNLLGNSGPDIQNEKLQFVLDEITLGAAGQEDLRPSPFFEKIRLRKSKNKKVTAALLAFPFPCGIVGLHRIYLGSAPYVPIVYIATIGGAFGILPFIDFCVLLIDDELEPYINNEKVFMWVK